MTKNDSISETLRRVQKCASACGECSEKQVERDRAVTRALADRLSLEGEAVSAILHGLKNIEAGDDEANRVEKTITLILAFMRAANKNVEQQRLCSEAHTLWERNKP